LSASDLKSFFFLRPADLARASSVSKTRKHVAAIPTAGIMNVTHQWSGIEEKTFVKKFMKLFCRTESDAERISRNLHAEKVTKGLS
jgi:hypothetical protein